MRSTSRGEWVSVHLRLRHGRSTSTPNDDVDTAESLANEIVRDWEAARALLDYAFKALLGHTRRRRRSELDGQLNALAFDLQCTEP